MALGLHRAAARPHRHQLARRTSAALKAYADANPDARWILGRGWNQELVGRQALPDRGRPRCGGQRPAGLARPGRRPCRGRQQRRDAGGRLRTQHPGAVGRPDRERPVRRRRDEPDRIEDSGADASRTGCGPGQGAGIDAVQRAHRRRRHGHQPGRMGGDGPRGPGRHAQCPHPELCRRHPGHAGDQRRQAERLALRRPAAPRRGQALRRRRARFARRLAEAALCRQAGYARACNS